MTLQSVPLSALQSPLANPRTRFDEASLEGLAASIHADGLLQNLVVAPVKAKRGKGKAAAPPHYRIVSGERRFRALKLLEARGMIEGDHDVAVEIREGLTKDDTLRLATIENLQREDLPPLDAATALAGLIRKGTTLEDLVARTGLSASTVKRRLALNGLSEPARAALRNDEITLAQAEALTLGGHEAQVAILDEIARGYSACTAEDIRAHFLDERPCVAMAIFPLERYTGTLTTDLFQDAETSYFDDADAFMALQEEAVERLAAEYRGKVAFVDVTRSYRAPDWQYEEPGDGQPAGMLINLSPNGHVTVHTGLAKPDELDADTAEATSDTPRALTGKPHAAYPAPLCRLIAWHKSAAVQEVLLSHARKAKEVLAVDLLMRLRPHEALRELGKLGDPQISYSVIDTQAALVARSLRLSEAEESGWRALVSERLDDLDAYAAVRALSDYELETLLVLLAVLPFGQDNCERLDTADSLFNAVARDLGIDMRNHWRVDAAFLNRRSRAQLLVIADECGFAETGSALTAWKKGDLVSGLLRHCEQARSAADPTPAQMKARAWLPDAFAFPARVAAADATADAKPGASATAG